MRKREKGRSCYSAKSGLALTILPQSPQCWDFKHALAHLAEDLLIKGCPEKPALVNVFRAEN